MIRNALLFFGLLASILCLTNFSAPADNGPHPYDLKYPSSYNAPAIPADNPLTEEGIWLGRLLFYDSILSVNGRIACSNCHLQKLSFTDGRPLSIGVYGDTLPRNSMTLINLAWHKHFFWNGRVSKLEDLIIQPITNPKEMGGLDERHLVERLKKHRFYPALFKNAFPDDSVSMKTVSKSIAQFLRTIVAELPPAFEKFKRYQPGSKEYVEIINENSRDGIIARAFLMQCTNTCHVARSFTFGGQTMSVYQNDSAFTAPILMNLKYTAPYMHDGRFKTMREVLQFYNDSLQFFLNKNTNVEPMPALTTKFTQYDLEHADELFDIYNDSTININPAFSDPFKQKGFLWKGNYNNGNHK